MTAKPLTLSDWRHAYLDDAADPVALLAPFLNLDASPTEADPAWITRAPAAFVQAQIERLSTLDRHKAPLFGVPFAVKDNIDVAGLPTTAACPAFAHTPTQNATAVQRLIDAGAVVVGKTNLDQFATGLVGTRSPYGEVPNTFDAAYVSGGSSSGSASVVARGLVPFALGTDTAGSGRVPAGLNNLVGLKPTPGSVPMAGVLPACRTLDVVSVYALTVEDAAEVMATMEGAEGEARFQQHAPRRAWLGRLGQPLRVGVPAQPQCDASLGYDVAFEQAVARARALGAEVLAIDMAPLEAVAQLLYEGPWVAERHAVLQALLESNPEAIDATVRRVIGSAQGMDATSAFRARYALEEMRVGIEAMWQGIDVLMVPTTPTCPTREAVAAEPVLRNSELGKYTNFVNLLGMAALAVPSGLGPILPFGVTFIAPGGSDAALAALGMQWQAQAALPLGHHLREADVSARNSGVTLPRAAPTLRMAVVGAHLAGMPLHWQLVERGCRLLASTTTSPDYRLFALPNSTPPKPGLARVASGGQAIAVEVYEMPVDTVGSFLALIPPPLGLGSVQLADGQWVKGFICEPWGLEGAQDISHHGGWRAYLGK